jgi:hypothetical protein
MGLPINKMSSKLFLLWDVVYFSAKAFGFGFMMIIMEVIKKCQMPGW